MAGAPHFSDVDSRRGERRDRSPFADSSLATHRPRVEEGGTVRDRLALRGQEKSRTFQSVRLWQQRELLVL